MSDSVRPVGYPFRGPLGGQWIAWCPYQCGWVRHSHKRRMDAQAAMDAHVAVVHIDGSVDPDQNVWDFLDGVPENADSVTLPTVQDLAAALMRADYEAALARPHCIDCSGFSNGMIPSPVRGHAPSTCPCRPREPRWPDPQHEAHARTALACVRAHIDGSGTPDA